MTDTPSSDEDPLLGVTIAEQYRVISRLGEGGMGVTYRAWDEHEGRPVVLKMPRRDLLENAAFAERFGREVRMMAALTHPSIVPILGMGEDGGLPFLAMRFLPGGSLSNRRLRGADGKTLPMQPSTLHFWLPAIASALDFVHANGIVHRDVKPANIFFDAFWGAYLGDFGIAKIVEDTTVLEKEHTLTATSMAIGTQEYMAPEQFRPMAVVDGRVDQYALAVMAYELLVGQRPFRGDTAHVIVEVTTQPVPRLTEFRRDLPDSLCHALYRGLSKTPDERFATCSEFAAALLRDVRPRDDQEGVARLLCPSCSNLLKMPTSAAGRQGKCPRCRKEMMVANDLGALWLVREEHDDGNQVVEPEGGDSESAEVFTSFEDTAPISRARNRGIWSSLDPQMQRAAIGAALLASIVASALLTGNYVASDARGKFDALTAKQKKLVAENERLQQEAQRPTAESAQAVAENETLKKTVESLTKEQKRVAAENEGLKQHTERLTGDQRRILAENESMKQQVSRLTAQLRSLLSTGTASGIQPRPAVVPAGALWGLQDSIGKTLSFQVVGSANAGSVWGSNPYTADSALAKAAVHAGVLQSGETGWVRVTILPGQQSYVGSSKNGVTTGDWGQYRLSYRLEGAAAAPQPPGPPPAPMTLSGFRGSIGKALSFRVIGSADAGGVWGSNPYTADSMLAKAAVHAGVLQPGEAGLVTVTILPGQLSYVGSTHNGVTTRGWGPFELSFRVERDRAETR